MHRRLHIAFRAFAFAAFAMFGGGQAALAQGVEGIGFAQAEEGIWHCRAGDPVTALNCARDLCRAEGNGQDCYRTAWCYPAGWAGVATVWLQDFHSNQPFCGAPSRDGLLALMRAYCESEPFAASCDARLMIDPDGAEYDIAERIYPAPSCEADAAQFALGQRANDETIEAARAAAGAAEIRPIGPGMAITRDYRLDRLNIEYDPDNLITRIWCG